ncbi:MAG TPA: HEAT repeat domain-containing protein [Waddliaceae bacterium]
MAVFIHLMLSLTNLWSVLGVFPITVSGPILYALHRGETTKAFENYLSQINDGQPHDFTLLQQAGKALLEQGMLSADSDIQLMCMFGAGVATSSDLLPVLEKGIKSADLRTQLVALSYLGKQQDDEADLILLEALSSPFLITRLEALLQLAKKNHPAVIGHLHSLTFKVPVVVRSVFAQIAIHLEGMEASHYLHRLLTDADVNVRVETILTVAQEMRDDFLPCLRALASGPSYAQQEATAYAFGELKDSYSIGRLKDLATSKQETVRLAAAIALYELGDRGYLEPIEVLARNGSLYAIASLGKLREGKETLSTLLTHSERDVRLNAVLALLNHRDREALNYLEEILIDDGRDLGFWRITSAGGGLKAWRTLSSASQRSKGYPGLIGQTMGLREKIVSQCIEFEEQDFLKIARLIFDKKQHALVPLMTQLLQNRKSKAVIQLLKEGYQKAGAPLIRNYCTLALYRLKEDGPYEEQLISWVKARGSEELIQFREEEECLNFSDPHQLTPEETSRFLVESCEALASAQNRAGLEVLIHALAYGNPKNRYALAGLLLRTTE